MIDINFTSRDALGNITYAWKSTTNTGIEILLQKIIVSAFSQTVTTYFNQIYGLDLTSAATYNFSSNVMNSDFQLQVTNDLNNLQIELINEDTINNIDFADRLVSLNISNLAYDTATNRVVLIILVSTNSSSSLLTLPIK